MKALNKTCFAALAPLLTICIFSFRSPGINEKSLRNASIGTPAYHIGNSPGDGKFIMAIVTKFLLINRQEPKVQSKILDQVSLISLHVKSRSSQELVEESKASIAKL